MFTSFKRVLNQAFTDFYRNKGISLAAVFILMITISLVTVLFFLHGASNFLISSVENKIDITAYFKSDTAEQDILTARDQIAAASPDIKHIEYVSKDQALANFTQNHKDNSIFSNALTQVGDNPFLPSLNITTTGNPAAYEKINTILQGDQFSSLIDKVDYAQKKDVIQKVFSITSEINTFGIGLAVILILVVILVVFNTIKLAINNSREEISTMILVGASSWFVRAPFIIQGALFGLVSFVICFVITIIATYFLSPGLSAILPGFSLWSYFLSNLFWIILLQLGFGVGLGGLASLIVVQKYLKV